MTNTTIETTNTTFEELSKALWKLNDRLTRGYMNEVDISFKIAMHKSNESLISVISVNYDEALAIFGECKNLCSNFIDIARNDSSVPDDFINLMEAFETNLSEEHDRISKNMKEELKVFHSLCRNGRISEDDTEGIIKVVKNILPGTYRLALKSLDTLMMATAHFTK